MSQPRNSSRRLPAKYFTALGRFNDQFTACELTLTCGISAQATKEASDDQYAVINALLGGVRMKAAKDTLNRFLRVTRQPKTAIEHTAKVFSHLGDIQYLRDRLAHHPTMRAGQKSGTVKQYINSDYLTRREWDKGEAFGFDLAALEAATADLVTVQDEVEAVFWPILMDKPIPKLELPTWQYKPSMLDRKVRRSLDNDVW